MPLEAQRLGWVAAVPWGQVPATLRAVDAGQLRSGSAQLPGTRLYGTWVELWGGERRGVLVDSATFHREQLHRLATTLAQACARLKAFSRELAQVPRRPWQEEAIRTKLARLLHGQWLRDLLVIDELQRGADDRWALQFHVDQAAFRRLCETRLGRTLIASNRLEWSDEAIVAAYYGQSGIEREFRALKDGDGCCWGPLYHWTDRTIRLHAFTIMLGLSLVNWLHRQVQQADYPLTREQLLSALAGIEDVVLAYPRAGAKGPPPTTHLRTYDTLEQRRLADLLQLERLHHPMPG